ncbi:DUF11 domain-containing protein [Candidatus Kaiserbacteria bacterium]|nr:DUF11 domain-containing protein [Candidatus Kaiserbacteria bacterium]USN91875.1 MAG: DUF11 domain-containing protein [Candidatus Nomurabacteria bacterium]
MKKYSKTIASVMVVFAMTLSAVANPFLTVAAFDQFDSQFGFDNSFNFDKDFEFSNSQGSSNGNTFESTTPGQVITSSSETFTECVLEASHDVVTVGDNITLNWRTSGFDSITINGQSVSGNSGSKVITNLRENSTFTLQALSNSGSSCFQQVQVTCLPPEEPKECKLEIEKTVNTTTAVPGDNLTYTITVKNTGDADCTGGGVKIEDVVDNNLSYLSHQLSGNFSAGYGGDPVYTTNNRTLHFNGNVLNPGESGTITWIGKVNAPTQCGDFQVKNQAKASAKELNNFQSWVYSQTVKTDIDNDCPEPDGCVLDVDKTVNKTTAVPGDNLTYTITVKNTGDTDCTGSGVLIEDVVDPNISYLSHSLSNDFLAGYLNIPVYTTNNRTLHFNGNILTPGESGTISWVGKVSAPNQCGDFEVTNQAKATAVELDNFQTWAYSQVVKTVVDNDCVVEDEFATVVAHKIVCSNEAELPNYGNDGPNITSNTATDWVATHNSCSLVSGWEFEWTDNQINDPGDTLIGRAGSPWNTFGPTDGNGKTSTVINLTNLTNDQVWFREVLQNGYIPFTHGANAGTNIDNVSAEFYCGSDVINYDNRDYIQGMQDDGVYYCVAWNSPIPEVPAPTCDLFTANPTAITAGDSSTLTWETSHASQVFLNNGIGEVAHDGSIAVSPLADIVYKLTVIGEEDKRVECEVPINVSLDSVPVCELFTATPNSLPYGGGSVALNWKVSNASQVSISPLVGSVELIGTRNVNVAEGTTFILTATDDNGDKVTCPAPVAVADPEPDPITCQNNVSFSASDTSIRRGGSSTLTWSTTDIDSVSISGINETSLSGSKKVSPSNDITYTLTATKGNNSINCPVSIDVSSGGGGGGSVSPSCELDISDTKIKAGEKITLEWDTSRATEVTLTDDKGKVLFTTDDYLAKDKVDYYDGSITLKPTRDTEYTLLAERGSRDEECKVKVKVEDDVVVLQTRDQQPLVAGISLSQVPYTGFEAGPIMTAMFYILLIAWAVYVSYLLVIRRQVSSVGGGGGEVFSVKEEKKASMRQKEESVRPDVFVASVTTSPAPSDVTPANLPTGMPVIGYENHIEDEGDGETDETNPHQVDDAFVTALENRAHSQKALLSSDAVRYFIGTTTNEAERNEILDVVIKEAKNNYPLEDGWIVINESRMRNLCEVCKNNKQSSEFSSFIPAVVPEGTGSLAEAIVTGNVVAAYQMIGNRPMFALADASADLDALYRQRKGGKEQVSNLLKKESEKLSDEKIKNMISALTGALDGVYTDEASAVKMAIMKAVKEVS